MQFGKRTSIVIGAVSVLLAASAALADDPAPFPACTKGPSPEDLESAKQSHGIATQRFNLQDWDKAVEFWRQAYAFDCTANALLVNIANAYEKKGDKKGAVLALETYLSRVKDAPDLVVINERLLGLKRDLEPAPTATATATAMVTAAPTVTATATATSGPVGARPYGSIPLIAAGVGGALALVGAIMVPVGVGTYNDARKVLLDAGCTPGKPCTLTDEVNQANGALSVWYAGGALLGVGLVAAIGSVGFHFVFNKPKDAGAPASAPPPKARLDIVPIVSPQVGGLSVSGQF